MKYYKGIGGNAGEIVEKCDALAYAMFKVGIQALPETTPLFMEWARDFEEYFYSGDWIEECAPDLEYMKNSWGDNCECI